MSQPTAIVTGAGRGIGRATAIELSRRGWGVMLVSRTPQQLEEACSACQGPTLPISADVTDPAALAGVVKEAIDRFGRIDGVVNNAGLAPLLPFEETDDGLLRRTIDTNLTAAFTLSRLAWPHLKKQGGGIVNLSSLSAIDPFPGFSAYAAAKAAINGLTVALAKEGAEHKIACHAVAPAGVETGMFRGLPGMAEYPAENLMSPAEIAAVIADCLTGPLRYASGETIYLRKTRA